ncbi:ABC transporter ATP-binding protein [Paenibacillus sp. HJGM_3]|uniref:ABC transporter ATP-binding protein n=1 Tax=Paenibacillus sp. HJGM_3 TaxID=3379816 RepID=UPI00385C0B92
MIKLFSYLRPHWLATLLAPLLMLLEVCMDLLQPILMASIIDKGVLASDFAFIRDTGLLMLGAALIGLAGGVGCTVFSSIASMRFGADLRQDLFRKVQTFSFRNLDELKTGSLITRLTGDIVQLQTMVQMLLRIFVRSPLLAIGSIVMAVILSPKLAAILAIAVPLLFAVMFLLIRKTLPLFSTVQMRMDRVNTVLQENFSGIRVAKAFVRQTYENDRFGRANADYTDVAIKAQRLVAVNMPILTMILNVCIVTVLLLGGRQAIDGSFDVGRLVAFINYVTQVLFSVSSVAMMLVRISSAKVSADRIQEVMATEPDIVSAAGPELVGGPVAAGEWTGEGTGEGKGEVTFDRVTFAYGHGDQAVLRELSFSVRPGQNVAIIGATGSGKTSLVGLIPRLYDASRGRVLIDGRDVRDYELQALRRRIGIVLQESILFTGSIRDNIRFGKPEASDEEVIAAAQAAQAHEFIAAMPEGYDTRLGQRGINLSGGQKQRISIARALIMQPDILILDDSTSAIDMGTESRIQAALARLMQGRTSFLVAQRISSVLDADKILVLDEGRLVAEGTHSELLASCELYQDIYRSQLGKEEPSYG